MGPGVAGLGWTDLLQVAFAGGLASAFLGKTADALLGRWQRRSDQRHQAQAQQRDLAHTRAMQKADQEHQRRMDREARDHASLTMLVQAHYEARDLLLDDAAGALEWLVHEWGAHDTAWVPEHDPTPRMTTVTEVLQALDRVETKHPTRSVRRIARELKGGISGHYGMIEEVWDDRLQVRIRRAGAAPPADLFQRWTQQARNLVEAMHAPPSTAEVQPARDRAELVGSGGGRGSNPPDRGARSHRF